MGLLFIGPIVHLKIEKKKILNYQNNIHKSFLLILRGTTDTGKCFSRDFLRNPSRHAFSKRRETRTHSRRQSTPFFIFGF